MDRPDYDVAVCTKTFNRPDVTRDVVESFENCVHKGWVDWWFFQDGAVNKYSGTRRAQDEVIEESVDVITSADLPNKTVEVNDYNLCHAEQTEKVWGLYDDYDLIIMLEGDIVVSKYFIIQMLSLMEQFPGMVGSLHGVGVDGDGRGRLDEVVVSGVCQWFTFAMWEDSYREIESRFNDFMDIVRGQDFWVGKRPSGRIKDEFETDEVNIAAGLDGAIGQVLRDKNIPRVKPRVCRCANIGVEGLNSSQVNYSDSSYGEEWPIEYEEDKEPRTWTVDKVGWNYNGEESLENIDSIE